MLVPEFYFRRWGGRRAGSGGKFEVPSPPPGRSVMEGGGRRLGAGQEGLGGSERPRLKARTPLTLGSLASNGKANDLGRGGSRGAVRRGSQGWGGGDSPSRGAGPLPSQPSSPSPTWKSWGQPPSSTPSPRGQEPAEGRGQPGAEVGGGVLARGSD